jgi:hypothetical protein
LEKKKLIESTEEPSSEEESEEEESEEESKEKPKFSTRSFEEASNFSEKVRRIVEFDIESKGQKKARESIKQGLDQLDQVAKGIIKNPTDEVIDEALRDIDDDLAPLRDPNNVEELEFNYESIDNAMQSLESMCNRLNTLPAPRDDYERGVRSFIEHLCKQLSDHVAMLEQEVKEEIQQAKQDSDAGKLPSPKTIGEFSPAAKEAFNRLLSEEGLKAKVEAEVEAELEPVSAEEEEELEGPSREQIDKIFRYKKHARDIYAILRKQLDIIENAGNRGLNVNENMEIFNYSIDKLSFDELLELSLYIKTKNRDEQPDEKDEAIQEGLNIRIAEKQQPIEL